MPRGLPAERARAWVQAVLQRLEAVWDECTCAGAALLATFSLEKLLLLKVYLPLTHCHTLTVITSGRQYSQSANTSCFWWAKGDLVRYRARVRPCELAGRWHDVMRAVQGGAWTSTSRSARGRRASNSPILQRTLSGVGPALRLTAAGVSTSPPGAVSQAAPWLDRTCFGFAAVNLKQAPQRERGVATREGGRLAPQ